MNRWSDRLLALAVVLMLMTAVGMGVSTSQKSKLETRVELIEANAKLYKAHDDETVAAKKQFEAMMSDTRKLLGQIEDVLGLAKGAK